MTNAAEVRDSRYRLEIAHDTDPESPREWDNLGTMVCWHNRYKLGDEHDYEDMSDLLKSLIRDGSMSDGELISYVQSGKADGVRLVRDEDDDTWELQEYDSYSKKWYTAGNYGDSLDVESSYVAEDILENLRTDDLLAFAERDYVIKPVCLYDHSVQSVSTDSFRGRAHHVDWDSGQVGVVFVSHEDIAKEYGDVSPQSIEKAHKALEGEVAEYDHYIRGDCYGFRLFDNGEEQDSCWGFLGDFDDALKAISEQLPQGAKHLAKRAEYGERVVASPPTKPDFLSKIEKFKAQAAAQPVKPASPAKNRDALE
jgi:hypothetical protein